jgi:FkbM family methyltransferase
MPYTFYAQQGEDIYTVINYINNVTSDGVFVEIGGFDGLTFSNTKFFEDVLGFKGVLIEPTEQFYKMKANRPLCDCYKLAVAKTKSKVKFLGDHATAGLVDTMADSFKEGWHKNSIEYEVDAEPFRDILARSNIKYIDFMTIDVEGGEQVV